MKTNSLLLLISCVLWSGCTPKTAPLPTDTWSQGCAELAPYQGTYRLSGLCCSNITFPKIHLDRDHSFSIKAAYYTFNGAGVINFPLVVNGKLSPDGGTLTLSYLINSAMTTHTLKPGKAIVSCDYSCD